MLFMLQVVFDAFLTEIVLRVISIIGLVALNGFFVLAEFSLVSVRPTRIDELVANGSHRAKVVKKLIDRQDDVISATQLGITIASLGLGWVGEQSIEMILAPFLGHSTTAIAVSAGLAFALRAYMHVVLGEIAPKSVALQSSESAALWVARPMQIFTFVSKPVLFFFNGTGWLFLSLFGVKPAIGRRGTVHSEDELKLLISQSETAGVLDRRESRILKRTFDLPDTFVKEIMTQFSEIESISIAKGFAEIVKYVKESGRSRVPIYEGETDNIIGVLYAKDLLIHFSDFLQGDSWTPGISDPDLRSILREPDYVPDTMKVIALLTQFQNSKKHVALVVDEFGEIIGLVSLEDVLEVLVGPISDEYDVDVQDFFATKDGVSVNPQISLHEFNQYFNTNFESTNSLTIAGFLMERVGRLPREGEVFNVEGQTFFISQTEGAKIAGLVVRRIQTSETSVDSPSAGTSSDIAQPAEDA